MDTLILKINPVMLGEGIPLFGLSKQKINLNLKDIKTYESGVIVPTYQIIYSN
nr:hypothetical protein [Alkalicoccobacillus porphyridii]